MLFVMCGHRCGWCWSGVTAAPCVMRWTGARSSCLLAAPRLAPCPCLRPQVCLGLPLAWVLACVNACLWDVAGAVLWAFKAWCCAMSTVWLGAGLCQGTAQPNCTAPATRRTASQHQRSAKRAAAEGMRPTCLLQHTPSQITQCPSKRATHSLACPIPLPQVRAVPRAPHTPQWAPPPTPLPLRPSC